MFNCIAGLSSLFGSVSFPEDDDDLPPEDSAMNSCSSIEVNIFACEAYQWICIALSYFVAEVYSLLQVTSRATESSSCSGSSCNSGGMYSRLDLCELEPEAVACLLRVLIRFVRSLISVDRRHLSEQQQECHRLTLEEVHTSLLPSAEDAVLKGFFSDGSTLIAHPPKAVFKHLRATLRVATSSTGAAKE